MVALSNSQTKRTAAARLNTSHPPLLNVVLPTYLGALADAAAYDVIVGTPRGGTWKP